MAEYAQTVLDMSDKIIYGDLLRFYILMVSQL